MVWIPVVLKRDAKVDSSKGPLDVEQDDKRGESGYRTGEENQKKKV
jgi:hypothetical protein